MNSNASWQARLLQSALSSWRRHRPVRLAGMTIVLALLGLALGTLCLRSAVVCADDVVELDLLATWFSDDQDATWSVAWGDVDGDGDLDLAAGNQLGPNKVYLNEGGTLQIAAAWASGDGDDTFGVAWGDVDADGDLDLVAGNYGQPNKLYLNDGGVLKTTPVWTDTVADDTRSVAWGDVNGDGLLDLAVGNWGYSKVYLNFKGALQTTPAWTTPVSEDTRSVAWGDVDGDGDLDLALGTSVSNKVYLNVGGVPQTIPAWVSGDSDNTFSVAWGDVDGDGDLDLAAGNTGGDPIKVYRNDGEGLGSGAWVLSGGAMSVAWGDVDEDGDLDLATTYWTIDRVYLNVAGGLGPSAAWTSGDEGSGQSVAWGDVDGDGDLDLAVGNFDSPNRVYVNQGGGLRAEASWLSGDDDVTFAVAWGDVDGDGDLDLAAGNRSRPNKVHLNDGGILRTSPVWTDTVSDDTWSVAWGDMDGDGRLDLAVGNYGQANKVYLGQGSALQATPAWTSLDSDGTAYVAWGDVDGDGDLDLAAANLGAPIKLYSNLDGILEEDATWESQDSGGGRSVAWGDVDGDGDLDLAVSSSGPNRVYLNRGGVLDPSAAWESADADDTEGIAWGDVDGDGDLDLAVGNWRGLNKVYLNQDGVLEVTASWTSGDSDYTYDVAWGDMDGDGDLDLAAGNLGGKNKVYRNDGVRLGTAAEHPWASDDESGTYCIVWGDADGDGDLDLAAGNSSEPNRVYLNGRPTHTPHPGQFPSVVLSLSGDPVQTFSQMVTALAPAGFYAVPGIRDARTIPMTYTLSHPAGSTVGYVRAFYSPDGGGSWRPAVATQTATTTLSTRLPIHYASPNTFPITISAASYVVSSTLLVLGAEDVADVDVWLNISHTWDGDLDVFVESPAGTLVELFTDVGSSGDGFLDTILDDEAAIPITSGTAPFSARYRPEGSLATLDGTSAGGLWTLWVTDDFLPADDGAILSWGINLQAGDGTHVYTWDTFASGFFGQSDDVVFRLEAYPQPVHTGIEGTYRYYDSVPGPYQRSYVAATTFPFRVRGTQARVISGTVPVSNAIVYRVPVGQSAGGHVLADASGEPFRTDSQGYLQGRGEIYPGDRLLALLPVSATESYTLYYTSGDPTVTGVHAYTVTQAGVQTLTVSAAHPLMLFDLDVSLEWDAHNDPTYLDELAFNLQRASEYLYDFTDGQVALGHVDVFQNADSWAYSHVLVHATNRMRPLAAQGGIVMTDTIDPDHKEEPDLIVYRPGQVHMGAVWNRYGNPGQSIGEDWPLILAHELGHYLLFHDDTYLGLDEGGNLIPVDTCTGSAMGDLYNNPDNTEFIFDEVHWEANCGETLAARTLGRNEWQTMRTHYTGLVSPTDILSGPTLMPFDVTGVEVWGPITPTGALEDPSFYLDYGGQYVSTSEARAYLQRNGDENADDYEYVIDLGSPYGGQNRLLARGAQPGDRVCVFDRPLSRFGCEVVELGDDQIQMAYDPTWTPIVQMTPINSTTLDVEVGSIPGGLDVYARLYPEYGVGSASVLLAPSGAVYSGTIVLDDPSMSGHIQVWVDEAASESAPRREAIVAYAMGGNPGFMRASGGFMRASGGFMRASGGFMRASGGFMRASGAPVVSPDGQMIFFTENPEVFEVGEFYTVQSMAGLPPLPAGRIVVGQGYALVATPGTPLIAGSVSIQYLADDVLTAGAEEEGLDIYFHDGSEWHALSTVRSAYFNLVTAPSEGPGVYALMYSVQVPLEAPGWNLFAYPLQVSLPVSEALLSVSGKYTTVYGYDSVDEVDPWKVYQVDGPEYLNDLAELAFGRGYWISATEAVTIYMAPQAWDVSLPPEPPDTHYGVVLGGEGFTPTVGMEVQARIGSAACGQGTVVEYGGDMVYVVDVMADDGGAYAGCGADGRSIAFYVGGQAVAPSSRWDNRQVSHVDLRPRSGGDLYLPVVLRRY